MSVTLTLEDEIDLSRGDMLVAPGNTPRVSRHFEAMVVWFNEAPAEPGRSYLLKHTSRSVRAKALKFRYRVNVNTLVQEPADKLHMNDIAYVEFETVSPLFFDPYTQNRITGSFILIDPISNATLGAGMIRADLSDRTAALDAEQKPVTAAERHKRNGHYPALILVEDIPSLAALLVRALLDDHFQVVNLDAAEVHPEALDNSLAVLQSAGLIVIYSCGVLDANAKQRLSAGLGDRFFDLSTLQLPTEETGAVRKILSLLHPLRVADQGKSH